MIGRIHSIETLGALDGPGVRIVIFLQGCPLRCRYCHNPDTWDASGGTLVESGKLLARALRFRPYVGAAGGVTLSGGEPLFQPEFAAELLAGFRREGLHTAVDTSGCVFSDAVCRALAHADLVLLDIKHLDEGAHRALTGVAGEAARAFLAYLRGQRSRYWARSVIVPGVNDSEDFARRLAAHLTEGGHAPERVELLPFHAMGMDKWRALGASCPLEGTPPPSRETLHAMEAILREAGLTVAPSATS